MIDAPSLDEGGVVAGVVSRAAALVIDVTVIAGAFYGALALGLLTVQVLTFDRLDPTAISATVASIMLAVWTAFYFWAAWWLFGKTVGKAVLGLRVVQLDGATVSWARSLVRVAGYALSVMSLGVGFAWVAVDRRRRAWHDMLAGTRVVYDWTPHPGSVGRAATPPTVDRRARR